MDGDPRRYYAAFGTTEGKALILTYSSDDSAVTNTRQGPACSGLFVQPGSHAQYLLCAHNNQTVNASQLLRFDPSESSNGTVSLVAQYGASQTPTTTSALDHESNQFWHLLRTSAGGMEAVGVYLDVGNSSRVKIGADTKVLHMSYSSKDSHTSRDSRLFAVVEQGHTARFGTISFKFGRQVQLRANWQARPIRLCQLRADRAIL